MCVTTLYAHTKTHICDSCVRVPGAVNAGVADRSALSCEQVDYSSLLVAMRRRLWVAGSRPPSCRPQACHMRGCVCGGAAFGGTGSCVSVRQTTTMVVRGLGRAYLCLSVSAGEHN